MKTALVLGAGGFIGSHMVKRLKAEGYWVRGVDLKYPEFSPIEADEFLIYDLRHSLNMIKVCDITYQEPFIGFTGFDEVYQFACLMGGAGFIFTGDNDADIMTSAKINLNLLDALVKLSFKGTVFYSSSACMYPKENQQEPGQYQFVPMPLSEYYSLRESDDYPANPDSEYGWEKLFSERLYLAYARNYGLSVRIARFHNIYGPEGTYTGGKEKAPAAICRKVAECNNVSPAIKQYDVGAYESIEIWGDGLQTRSFLYIDDCIDAVRLLMQSDFTGPVNIGSEEMISINDLARMVIEISGKSIYIKNIPGPVGVRGRNSDNALIREKLGWEPKYKLQQGMELLYKWIKSQYDA